MHQCHFYHTLKAKNRGCFVPLRKSFTSPNCHLSVVTMQWVCYNSIIKLANVSNKLLSCTEHITICNGIFHLIENLSGNGRLVGRVETFSLFPHTSCFLFVVGVDVVGGVWNRMGDKDSLTGSLEGQGEMGSLEHWMLKSCDVTAIEEQLPRS